MGKTVMVFGIGELGGWVPEFLARGEDISTIITCDVKRRLGWHENGVCCHWRWSTRL